MEESEITGNWVHPGEFASSGKKSFDHLLFGSGSLYHLAFEFIF
jgi:hypothetical protein